MNRLTIAVFSFNRGDWLRNCLDSVVRHAPGATLRIYDDGSDDPATLAVLADHAGLVRQPKADGTSKHGGLYGNMQAALAACETPYLFCLQDDMQLVRPITAADMATIDALFAADPGRAFVYPLFIKAGRLAQTRGLLAPLDDLPAYGPAPGSAAAARFAYADVSIADVARLQHAGWTYGQRERDSIAAARAAFAAMPFLAHPFAFFCPEVPVFRDRRRTLATRIAARLNGDGVKAYHDMTAAEVAAMMARDPAVLPVAEDFLRPVNRRVRKPFVYQDFRIRWWLALLHRVESGLRRGLP